MKSLVHTEELCSLRVPLEHTPGAKSLVCIGLKQYMNKSSFFKEFINMKNHFDQFFWQTVVSTV